MERQFEMVHMQSQSIVRTRLPDYEKEINNILSESVYAPSFESVRQFIQMACEPNAQSGEKKYFFALTSVNVNHLLGFCQFRLVGPDADLDYVGIGSLFRRQGCAQALLQMAFVELKRSGAERVILEVGASNAGAIQLYMHLGFVQIAKRAKYYKTGEDALVMELVF